ncbi:MAG: amidase [Salinirussus sp.]
MFDPYRSAADIAADVQTGALDPLDVVDATLDRIDDRRDRTNAFITVLDEDARERAEAVRNAVEAGEELPLAGVPVGMKDLAERKAGVPATEGFPALSDNVATETSETIRRLEAAGAIVVGTTNTPALGHTVRTLNDLVGPTGTPFDPDYNAGGSSGGSGAALADGLCTLATGSDVGGSLRNPASCCGVVAVKPSAGVVPSASPQNAFGHHSPVSVRGPMARDIDSLARMLDVMAGAASVDPFAIPADREYKAAAEPTDPATLDLAYSPGLDLFPIDPTVRASIETTLDELEGEGATVDRISIDGPDRHTVNQTYKLTSTTYFARSMEALRRETGIDLMAEYQDDLPDVLVAMVEVGRSHDMSEYAMADFPRTALYHAIEAVFEEYDALVCPTLATPPLTHDEPIPEEIDGVETHGMPTDWATGWVFNLTGHPVVNVPAEPVNGLPVGMQVVGPTFSEPRLLGIAATVEEIAPWSYPQ